MITTFDGKNFATSYRVGRKAFDEVDLIVSCETDAKIKLGISKDDAYLLLFGEQEVKGWILKEVLETEL